jgi:RNA polymerase sigma-70 factor (ECF subfamily)
MLESFNSRYKELDDNSLLDRFKKTSNPELLGVLYHRYMHLVYGVGLKYLKDPEESKDAVMQIFEKLVISIPNQDIRNFKSWLYTVTKNHCLWLIKNKRLKANVVAVLVESQSGDSPNGEAKTD